MALSKLQFARILTLLLFLPMIVGGIYSVIKSKAPVTTAEYGDRYTLIGPLHAESVSGAWAIGYMALVDTH